MNDLISVIIPVYNSEKNLRNCLRSVLTQSYKNIEVVVVDDGSFDGSPEICDEYMRDNPAVKVFHIQNHGVSYARNIGLDNASGEYICFLDSDDELMPDALETLYGTLRDNLADISVGKKVSIDQNGGVIKTVYPFPNELWKGEEGLTNSLKDHPATYSVWGKLYKRELISDIRFAEGKKINEDSFFVFECLLKQPVVAVIDKEVVKYNITQNSASRGEFSEKYLDILYFAEEKERIINDSYPQMNALAENMLIKAHLSLLNNLIKTFDKKYRAQEKKSLRFVRTHKSAFIPATANDIKFFNIVIHRRYYPRKIIKRITKGVFS